MLLVNLRMDATYIKEGMNITWVAEVSEFMLTLVLSQQSILGRVVHYTYTSHSSTLTVSFICIYRYPFAKCRNGNARSLLLTVAVTIRRKSRLNGKSPHNYSISSGSVVGLAFRGFSRCVKGDRVQVEAEGLRNRTVFRVNIFQSVTHGYA